MASFQTLPGFREFYPDALARRNHLFRLWRQTAHTFGFAEYDAPVLEPLELYKTKSGDEIEAQLFSFTDKGGREVALRPEMTPTVCRLVGERANALKRPIKWFSIAEFYRYERMQKGRGRCFFQFNADIFGEPGIEAETELIALLAQNLCAFGLTEQDFYIRLSDRNLWFFFLEALGFDDARSRSLRTSSPARGNWCVTHGGMTELPPATDSHASAYASAHPSVPAVAMISSALSLQACPDNSLPSAFAATSSVGRTARRMVENHASVPASRGSCVVNQCHASTRSG